MHEVRRDAGGLTKGRTDEGGPLLGTADVDIALGDVGDPVAQGGQVVDVPDVVPEPRLRPSASVPGATAPAGPGRC